MAFLLWLIAVILVVYGIVLIVRDRRVVAGVLVIVVGLLIGPGGVSVFDTGVLLPLVR
jgi:hypothetical protein